MTEQLFDVVAVSLDDSSIIWAEPNKTEADAEAVIKMAVMRQGVEDRFFGKATAGKYEAGDKYEGAE